MIGTRRASAIVLAIVVAAGAVVRAQPRRPRDRDFFEPVRSWAASESRTACPWAAAGAPLPVPPEARIGLVGDPVPLPDGGHVAIVRAALGRRDASGTEGSRLFAVGLRPRRGGRGWDRRRMELDFGVIGIARPVVHAARLEDVDDDGELELFLDVEVETSTDCDLGHCTVRRIWILDALDPSFFRGALHERSFTCDGAHAERRTAEITLRDVDGDGHRDIVVSEHRCVVDRQGERVCRDQEQAHLWRAERDDYAAL